MTLRHLPRKEKAPDLVADAWSVLERAIKVIGKAKPKHRTKKGAESSPPKRGKRRNHPVVG